MKCSRCGTELPDTAKYCTKCGAKAVFVINDQLIRLAIAGNQDAVSELYDQTYNRVYRTVKAIIRADEDTVLDIVQDTYVRGFQYLSQLDKAENFVPWIKRIGANTAKNYLKKKKPLLFSEMSSEEDEAPELRFEDDRPENLPEIRIDQQETARLIGQILDSLSDEQRMALTMFYYSEMSVKEIAQTLGCSENTVKSRLNYGRQKVKVKVEELEKKGTKLYSLSPIPFLLLLLRSQETQSDVLPNAAIRSVLRKNCAKAVRRTSAGEASASAKAGTKALSTKIIAGIAAAAVVGTSAVAVPRLLHSTERPVEVIAGEAQIHSVPEVTAEAEQPEETKTAQVTNDHSLYDGILSDFEVRYRNQEGMLDGRGNAYGFWDLNGDGQDELLISDLYEDDAGQWKVFTVCGIYTVIEGEPEQIAVGWSRNRYTIYEDGCILNAGSSGAGDSSAVVLRMNPSGALEETDISPEALVQEAQIPFVCLEQLPEAEAAGTDASAAEGSGAPFDEILTRIKIVIQNGITAYETRPDQMEEEFSDLGEGVVWLLTHREQDIYTVDFFSREYDIDGDGENELLLGRGISPSRVQPIAIYKIGRAPVIGDALYGYSFPEDGYFDTPQWNYIDPEIF